MKPVKPLDWGELKPLTSERATLPLSRLFSQQEITRIRLGLLPAQMEDKWFVYWLDNSLHFHRSWTGHCIYIVRFKTEGEGCRMIAVDVSRDESQYCWYGEEREPARISNLIDMLLLRRETDSDEVEPLSENQTLEEWSQVGRAMLGQHPDGE